MVYVISQKNKPLMPCSNPIARLLLKQYSTYQMWKIHGDCLSKQYWKHYILVGLVKFRKRLLKNISKIKDNGNERCVSTHLKVCGFAAVNI